MPNNTDNKETSKIRLLKPLAKSNFAVKSSSLREILIKSGKFQNETFVIKISADIVSNESMLNNFAEQVSILKGLGISIVVVHDIDSDLVNLYLEKCALTSEIPLNSKIVDHKATKIFEMVSGLINKDIVSALNKAFVASIGISGKDCNLMEARKSPISKARPESKFGKIFDLGFIGNPLCINPESLMAFEEFDLVTVISPIAYGENSESHILNSDLMAALVASVLIGSKLLIHSPEGGIKIKGELCKQLYLSELKPMIKKYTYSELTISAIHAILCALENYVTEAHIIDSSTPEAMITGLFSNDSTGTIFLQDNEDL